ncbi:MAG: hypothetical protein HKO96_04075 [Flavobacteriaceae bacterium]|nr:hypothetical protein [Bacteroidia bacterium]NNK69633.1 hypothetical protein [Flavobacteriaceae bacterium]
MKFKYFLFILLFLSSLNHFAQDRITSEDLSSLAGDWTGTLTYIDYSSGNPFTMPADLSVQLGTNNNQLTLFNIYPNEPKANNKDKIKISANGEKLNGKNVMSVQRNANGTIEIITEFEGKDNRKKALIRSIYIVGNEQFIIRKEVKFQDSDEWLKRNEFKYKRKQ